MNTDLYSRDVSDAHFLFPMKRIYELPSQKKRKPYNYIESETRRWLLHLVKDRGFKIKEAAQALQINYSTAKTILQLYKRSGRIDKIDKHLLIAEQLHYAN